MIQFILMLFGLTFANHNANTSLNNNGNATTIQNVNNIGTRLNLDTGTEDNIEKSGPIGGNTGQLPPPPRL